MKTKTIKSVLRNRIKGWINSIEDEALRARLEEGVIVTGGAIPSMLLGEKVNDYDVYLRSRDLVIDVANYYVKQYIQDKNPEIVPVVRERSDGRVAIMIKSKGIATDEEGNAEYKYFEMRPPKEAEEYVAEVFNDLSEEAADELLDDAPTATDKPKYRVTFMSCNAISLTGKIQIVLRFFGEPEEIHKNYDFVHCTGYWCSWNGNLVLPNAMLETLLAKELRYVGSLYPVCSLFRVRKYLKRGFTITAGQLIKIAWQISQLDLTNPAVLEDQLIGVDVAYMHEIIEKLKAHIGDGKVDGTYLFELIDRIF